MLGAVLLAVATAAAGDPLGVRTPGTLRELFLDLPLSDARGPAGPSLEARWSLANDWSTPTALVRGPRVVVLWTDEQADSLELRLRLPWSRLLGPGFARLSTSLDLRLTAHWGGWTDGAIEAWHRLGGYYDFQRSAWPRDHVRLLLVEPPHPPLIDVASARVAPGDVALRTQWVLAAGGESHSAPGRAARGLSARLDLKVPLGSLAAAGGSGGWDAGVALLGTAELASWLTAHAMLSGSVWSGLPGGFALQPRLWHGGAEVSFVFRAGRWELLVEDRVLTPAFEPGWTLAGGPADPRGSAYFATFRAHNQVTLGVRFGALSAWFSEDFTPGSSGTPGGGWFYDSNAPDVVLGLAWSFPL